MMVIISIQLLMVDIFFRSQIYFSSIIFHYFSQWGQIKMHSL